MTKYEQMKGRYRLWVDFLKESDGYKNYCQNTVNTNDLKDWPLERIYLSGWNQLKEDSTLTIKSQHKFFGIYLVFRDVHSPNYDFEKWWKTIMLELIKLFEKQPGAVLKMDHGREWYTRGLIDDLGLLLDAVYEGFAQGKPLEKDYIMDLYKIISERTYRNYIEERRGSVLLLAHTLFPKKDLMKEFTEKVIEHKKRYSITDAEEKESINNYLPIPSSERFPSELSTYLDVYRLRKQGEKWIEVVGQISSEANSINMDKVMKDTIDENTRRVFQGYHKKARNIIKNVENGSFPGKY